MVDVKVIEVGPGGKEVERMEKREQKEIQIVREDWIWDCVRCGGRWAEEEYGIERRREDIKPKGKPRECIPRVNLCEESEPKLICLSLVLS
jgi:hypothetical protein